MLSIFYLSFLKFTLFLWSLVCFIYPAYPTLVRLSIFFSFLLFSLFLFFFLSLYIQGDCWDVNDVEANNFPKRIGTSRVANLTSHWHHHGGWPLVRKEALSCAEGPAIQRRVSEAYGWDFFSFLSFIFIAFFHIVPSFSFLI